MVKIRIHPQRGGQPTISLPHLDPQSSLLHQDPQSRVSLSQHPPTAIVAPSQHSYFQLWAALDPQQHLGIPQTLSTFLAAVA